MNKVYFGIDYGDTVGYSVIDESGSVFLLGSNTDSQICIEQLELALKYYAEISVVMEKQIGVKTERFTNFIEKVTLLCKLSNTPLLEVYPHIWKNSFIGRTKPKPSNHALDSVRISLFGIYKQSEN